MSLAEVPEKKQEHFINKSIWDVLSLCTDVITWYEFINMQVE